MSPMPSTRSRPRGSSRWGSTARPSPSSHRAMRATAISPPTRRWCSPSAPADVLARSAHLRYQEALGRQVGEIPEGLYPGDYLKPVGAALAAEFGDRYADAPESAWLETFRRRTVAAMLDLIKTDLAGLGVYHDLFASEREVQESGAVDRALALLDAKGLVYTGTLPPPKGKTVDDWEPTELLLFRSTAFGDDQGRPIRNSAGSWT